MRKLGVATLFVSLGIFCWYNYGADYPPDPEPVPVFENFPAAAAGHIPEILEVNRPPKEHPETPLFIGFTRNWPILQQAVISYITAGWPPEEIIVVDNTGTMDSNELGLLTLQNPFFVDYPRLRLLGIQIVRTSTLLTFAQLQNFFLSYSIEKGWDHFYWSHMDSVVISWEDRQPYRSLYANILADWAVVRASPEKWAARFYNYDRLALVNVAAYKAVGGWDTQIPFYTTDCDMHARLEMAGYTLPSAAVGQVYDVPGSITDLGEFFPESPLEPLDGERVQRLRGRLEALHHWKNVPRPKGRNFWQAQQRGGRGEPFYRDPEGFERAVNMWIDYGKRVFYAKWTMDNCEFRKNHRQSDDAWKIPSRRHGFKNMWGKWYWLNEDP